MRLRPAPLALALLLAAAGARGEDDVTYRLVIHSRLTSARNLPGTDVLFDPATRAFALDRYLGPRPADGYASWFAAAAVDGHALDGDLRWALAFDTGEVRRRRDPAVDAVCFATAGQPTGLDLASSGSCRVIAPVVVPLESTTAGPRAWTSNGRPLRDEARKTLLLREAYLSYAFGPAGFASARVGRRRTAVGDGFVFDDYGLGAELRLDLGAIGPPLEVAVTAFDPSRDLPESADAISPMVAVRVDYLPSLFEHLGVFAAGLRDRSGSTGELLRSALIERLAERLAGRSPGTSGYASASQSLAYALSAPLQSEATLGWLGASGSLALAGQRLSFTGALLRGTIDRIDRQKLRNATFVPLAEDVRLEGSLAAVRLAVGLGRRVTATPSFLFLSGGELPRRAQAGDPITGTYRGFLGVAPYVATGSHLFFGGGLSETFAARHVTAPGVNGRGVLSPGLTVDWQPHGAVSLQAQGAWLRADAPGPGGGGSVYGTEVDLTATWAPAPWILVGVEYDVLFPGSFFAYDQPMSKAVVALDLLTP